METTISKGKKAADKDILSLTEQLMTQLINLDGVVAEGDQKIQRAMQVGSFAIYCFQSTIISTYFDAIYIYICLCQVRRVQKYVEKLDELKIKNAKIVTTQQPSLHQKRQQQQPTPSVVVTQEWEMFDSLFGPITSTTTSSSSTSIAPQRTEWELF